MTMLRVTALLPKLSEEDRDLLLSDIAAAKAEGDDAIRHVLDDWEETVRFEADEPELVAELLARLRPR